MRRAYIDSQWPVLKVCYSLSSARYTIFNLFNQTFASSTLDDMNEFNV